MTITETISTVKTELHEDNVHLLTFEDGKRLYLIGTAHVSESSVKLVEKIIVEVKPDTICVELDEGRRKSLQKSDYYDDVDIIKIIRDKQLFFFIGQFIMSSYQKKISDKTGSRPGMEFLKAMELAEQSGARLVMADRNIGVTLKRAYRCTPLSHKMKLLAGLFTSDNEEIESLDIEKMKQHDAIDRIVSAFADELPVTKRVLIDERDEYLSTEIRENMGMTTVAVVGAGHVPGMLKILGSSETADNRDELMRIPGKSLFSKVIPWLIPALIAGLFAWGIAGGSREAALDGLYYWILSNGLMAAAGCIIALGHPLTIITGMVAAPITSLSPAIGVGFFTALVQTLMRKPRVKDFEEMRSSTMRFRDWWKNRLTRVFLVFIFSSIGSSIATFVAIPVLKKLFTN